MIGTKEEFLQEFVTGYIDGLKDSGEWIEMTKEQKLEAGKEAIDYGEKMEFYFNMIFKMSMLKEPEPAPLTPRANSG